MTSRFTGALALAAVVSAMSAAGQQPPPVFQLAWVDRQGTMTRIGPLPPGTFAPRLSPDGRRVAFDTFDGTVWIAELANLAAPRRFAFGRYPMWSPDGNRLLFAGAKGFQLYWQATDGSGIPELIAETARAPESWSPAARLVSYITFTGTADYDIWAFSPDDRSQRALLATPTSAQLSSRFSPDGKWLAYQSNESGRYRGLCRAVPAHRRAHTDQRRGRRAAGVVARRPRDLLRPRRRALRGRRRPRQGAPQPGSRRRCRSEDSCRRRAGGCGTSHRTDRAS